jgi:hypothetical protein
VFGAAAKNRHVEPPKMRNIQVTRREFASANSWDVKKFDKGYDRRVLRQESDSSEVPMIATSIPSILGKQEWMVNPVTAPEHNSVFVVLENAWKDFTPLNVWIVVRIQTHKEELSGYRLYSLKRAVAKVQIELATWVRLVHVVGRVTEI